MSLNRLESRVARLEKKNGGRHCDGCNRTAALRISFCERSGLREIDWSKTDLAQCPVCGNRNPRMSIQFLDELYKEADAAEQGTDEHEQRISDSSK